MKPENFYDFEFFLLLRIYFEKPFLSSSTRLKTEQIFDSTLEEFKQKFGVTNYSLSDKERESIITRVTTRYMGIMLQDESRITKEEYERFRELISNNQ